MCEGHISKGFFQGTSKLRENGLELFSKWKLTSYKSGNSGFHLQPRNQYQLSVSVYCESLASQTVAVVVGSPQICKGRWSQVAEMSTSPMTLRIDILIIWDLTFESTSEFTNPTSSLHLSGCPRKHLLRRNHVLTSRTALIYATHKLRFIDLRIMDDEARIYPRHKELKIPSEKCKNRWIERKICLHRRDWQRRRHVCSWAILTRHWQIAIRKTRWIHAASLATKTDLQCTIHRIESRVLGRN